MEWGGVGWPGDRPRLHRGGGQRHRPDGGGCITQHSMPSMRYGQTMTAQLLQCAHHLHIMTLRLRRCLLCSVHPPCGWLSPAPTSTHAPLTRFCSPLSAASTDHRLPAPGLQGGHQGGVRQVSAGRWAPQLGQVGPPKAPGSAACTVASTRGKGHQAARRAAHTLVECLLRVAVRVQCWLQCKWNAGLTLALHGGAQGCDAPPAPPAAC